LPVPTAAKAEEDDGVSEEHERLRARLGRVGVWTFTFDDIPAGEVRRAAAEIEALGYPALWVPEGGSSREIFAHLSLLLDATERIAVCSGIANTTARHPHAMANGARTLADAHGDRPVIGIGIAHQYTTAARGLEWTDPVGRMRAYLDEMDRAPAASPEPEVPVRRLLAALGPKMLALSAERALGAHSYFVPIEHTAGAREVLGPEPVLAVEQTVVLEADRERARAIARDWAIHYLELPNYANNLRRLGFSDDEIAGRGSDRLVDATVAWGEAPAIAERVRAHLDAGADHVCVQVITGDEGRAPVAELRELAPVLRSV
jgi:probable F420-dependent oxidoreductase